MNRNTAVLLAILALVCAAVPSRLLGATNGFVGAAFPEQPFKLQSVPANLARWMYAFNANPESRPTASAFAAFGSIPDFDTRDAQFLLGWDTTNRVPAGKGAKNYLIRRVRVTLTISSDNQYTYTGTLRDYRTYFPSNDPRYLPPTNTLDPVELFGAGFRGGYSAVTFQQDTPFLADPAGGYYTNRSAYAAGFNSNGVLVDVSNNVGDDGTNEIASAFEVAPFAVGQTTNVAPGELMPVGSQLTFDLNLDDPQIYGYVQSALDEGHLSFVASSLVNASLSGPPNYASFYTMFSALVSSNEYPLVDIEGAIVRPGVEIDGDGLPDDWENFHFGSLSQDATDDTDGDGFNHLAEYQAGTVPTDATSALRLLSLQQQSNGAELHFAFAPNRQYVIQWSDNISNWQAVTNPPLRYSSAWISKTGANPSYQAPVSAAWQDTNAASPQRFYRIGAQEEP